MSAAGLIDYPVEKMPETGAISHGIGKFIALWQGLERISILYGKLIQKLYYNCSSKTVKR